MIIAATKPIQIGDNTHHQDQLIYPMSLRTMKTIVRSPVNPIPLLEEELLSAIKLLCVFVDVRFIRPVNYLGVHAERQIARMTVAQPPT
jgi:hypothetical protein